MGASRSSSESSTALVKPRYSFLLQSVDMRKRVEPPFSPTSIGSLAAYSTLQEENEIYENRTEPIECELQDLVSKLRQGIKEFKEKKGKRFPGDRGLQAVVEHFMEGLGLITRADVHFFYVTSWCNFQFYEVYLGWGKPIHVTIPSSSYENAILLDTRDGDGAKLLLTLSKENMALVKHQLERFFRLLLKSKI